MEIVQITLTDTPYTNALRELLERGGVRQVRCVNVPDPSLGGVIVVDSDALNLLPFPLPNPERIVLITRNDPQHLSRAWNAGVRSVVFSQDPIGTAVLAIMAAELRAPRAETRCPGAHTAASRLASARGRKGG
jgi:hypothetical protein